MNSIEFVSKYTAVQECGV